MTEQKKNINEISDGLTGEMYTEDGWIYRFRQGKMIISSSTNRCFS